MPHWVFSKIIVYYFIHVDFSSAQSDQHNFKKVLYVWQITSISFLLKRVTTNEILSEILFFWQFIHLGIKLKQ